MVKPVISVPDANGATLSQKIFFTQGMKQAQLRDSSATLTLKEYYDVAIQFAQSIPHPKAVGIKLFYMYTSSEHQQNRTMGQGTPRVARVARVAMEMVAELVAGVNLPRGLTHWTAP